MIVDDLVQGAGTVGTAPGARARAIRVDLTEMDPHTEHRVAARARGWRRLLTEAARPQSIAARPDAAWLAVGAVCIGAFMGQLDASIVTLALPTMQRDLGVDIGAIEWVALAYLLALVSSVVVVGRLSDWAGRKLVYTYGFAVFTVGSVLCAFAPTLSLLVAARVLQGLGAAMLQANSVALVATMVGRERLSRAIGIQSAAQAVGLGLGPAVGGLLIALGGWRLIFLVNLPAGAIGVALAWLLLPRTRQRGDRAPFDAVGTGLLVAAICSLLVGLSLGQEVGWTQPGIDLALALVPLLSVSFVLWERHAVAPLVDLRLFETGAFSLGIAAGLLAYLVLFGVLFVVPFYLEMAQGLSTVTAGLELTALPVALGITAPFAGRLADRHGPRVVTTVGMLVTAAALLASAAVRGGTAPRVVELVAVGVGLGAFTPGNNASVMGSVGPTQSGVASGILNMTRGLGTALGVATTSAIFGLMAAATRGGTGGDSPAAHGFGAASAFLACLALATAVISVRRPRGRIAADAATTA